MDNLEITIKIKKVFDCGLCDYKCAYNANLKVHIKMKHDKIKDVKCEKCEYTCGNNSDLKKTCETGSY